MPQQPPKDTALDIFKHATHATMRAIAGDKEFHVQFESDTDDARAEAAAVPVPVLTADCPETKRSAMRGIADEHALRHRYHQKAEHRRLMPTDSTAAEIFTNAEQARIFSIGANRMVGVGHNLRAALEESCAEQGYHLQNSMGTESLALAVSLIIRERLTGEALPPVVTATADHWRQFIERKIGPQLDGLRAHIHDQAEYARYCRHLIQELGFDVEAPALPEDDTEQSDVDSMAEDAEGNSPDTDAAQLAGDTGQPDDADISASQATDTELDDAEQAAEEQMSGGIDERGCIRDDPNYNIYTTQFDETVLVSKLCELDEIEQLYNVLTQKLQTISQGTSRLASRLQRQLMAKQVRSWLFDQDEGLLDASRLAGIVANPYNVLAFKRESEAEFHNTVVSLLIDNSGSMRGRSIALAAMCADMLGRTLERCAIKSEILGFTTRNWRGGRAREQWLADGQPRQPGRLNDVRHIVYKSADEGWHRAKRNLGLMMREELLKENIDGEALIWAHNRLVQRKENRKILMVISDGLPVDNSTLLVNPSNCLEQHLQYAIDLIETKSPVELVAIGIGHDVTHHYRHAVTITDPEQLGGAMTDQLVALFDVAKNKRLS